MYIAQRKLILLTYFYCKINNCVWLLALQNSAQNETLCHCCIYLQFFCVMIYSISLLNLQPILQCKAIMYVSIYLK